MYGMSAKDRLAKFEGKGDSGDKKPSPGGPKKIGRLSIGGTKKDESEISQVGLKKVGRLSIGGTKKDETEISQVGLKKVGRLSIGGTKKDESEISQVGLKKVGRLSIGGTKKDESEMSQVKLKTTKKVTKTTKKETKKSTTGKDGEGTTETKTTKSEETTVEVAGEEPKVETKVEEETKVVKDGKEKIISVTGDKIEVKEETNKKGETKEKVVDKAVDRKKSVYDAKPKQAAKDSEGAKTEPKKKVDDAKIKDSVKPKGKEEIKKTEELKTTEQKKEKISKVEEKTKEQEVKKEEIKKTEEKKKEVDAKKTIERKTSDAKKEKVVEKKTDVKPKEKEEVAPKEIKEEKKAPPPKANVPEVQDSVSVSKPDIPSTDVVEPARASALVTKPVVPGKSFSEKPAEVSVSKPVVPETVMEKPKPKVDVSKPEVPQSVLSPPDSSSPIPATPELDLDLELEVNLQMISDVETPQPEQAADKVPTEEVTIALQKAAPSDDKFTAEPTAVQVKDTASEEESAGFILSFDVTTDEDAVDQTQTLIEADADDAVTVIMVPEEETSNEKVVDEAVVIVPEQQATVASSVVKESPVASMEQQSAEQLVSAMEEDQEVEGILETVSQDKPVEVVQDTVSQDPPAVVEEIMEKEPETEVIMSKSFIESVFPKQEFKPIPEEFYNTLFYFSGMGAVIGSAISEGVYVDEQNARNGLDMEFLEEREKEKDDKIRKSTKVVKTAREQATDLSVDLKHLQALLDGMPSFSETGTDGGPGGGTAPPRRRQPPHIQIPTQTATPAHSAPFVKAQPQPADQKIPGSADTYIVPTEAVAKKMMFEAPVARQSSLLPTVTGDRPATLNQPIKLVAEGEITPTVNDWTKMSIEERIVREQTKANEMGLTNEPQKSNVTKAHQQNPVPSFQPGSQNQGPSGWRHVQQPGPQSVGGYGGQPTSHVPSQPASQLVRQPAREPPSQPPSHPVSQPLKQPQRRPGSQPQTQPQNHCGEQPKDGVKIYGVYDPNVIHQSKPWQERYGKKMPGVFSGSQDSQSSFAKPRSFSVGGSIETSQLKPWQISRARAMEARGYTLIDEAGLTPGIASSVSVGDISSAPGSSQFKHLRDSRQPKQVSAFQPVAASSFKPMGFQSPCKPANMFNPPKVAQLPFQPVVPIVPSWANTAQPYCDL